MGRSILLASMLTLTLLLSACHTMDGIGEDLSSAGKTLSGSAEKHTP